MRLLAEMLFWLGRWETILCIVILLHGFAVWYWRHDLLQFWAGCSWLLLFIISSAVMLRVSDTLRQAINGTGYLYAHLYQGIWSDEAALSNMLDRWKFIWFPVYLPWLSIWLIGLILIAVIPILRRLVPK